MLKFGQIMKDSLHELKSVRAFTLISMLTALNILLQFATVIVNDFIHIAFGFLTTAAVGMLYGPVAGMMSGGLSDILKYLIKPVGAYFPGYTLTAVLVGMVFGLILYKQRPTLPRLIVARLLTVGLLTYPLNSLWQTLTIGTPLPVLLAGRGIKALAVFPIDVFLLFTVLNAVLAIYKASYKRGAH